MLMIVLDITVVNVALPSIQDDLGFCQNDLSWVVNAYLITFGGLLLLAGRLGDLIGRRTIFLSGLARLHRRLAALRRREQLRDADRRALHPGNRRRDDPAVILGMIATMFPERARAGQGDGRSSRSSPPRGGTIGLLAGGALTETINWHWIFLVNVPIAIVTALLARRYIERDEGIGIREGADVPGAVLLTSALMLGIYTIVKPVRRAGLGRRRDAAPRRGLARAARRSSSPARRPRRRR